MNNDGWPMERRRVMTRPDAETIRRAALIMLHVVAREVGGNDLMAALRTLPLDADRVSLRAARVLLEASPAWMTAKE